MKWTKSISASEDSPTPPGSGVLDLEGGSAPEPHYRVALAMIHPPGKCWNHHCIVGDSSPLRLQAGYTTESVMHAQRDITQPHSISPPLVNSSLPN